VNLEDAAAIDIKLLRLRPGIKFGGLPFGIRYRTDINPTGGSVVLSLGQFEQQILVDRLKDGRCYFCLNGRRYRRVYLGSRGFESRDTLGLKYRCQRLSAKKRQQYRIQRIVSLLRGIDGLIKRPRFLHSKRWHFLRNQYCALTHSPVPEPWSKPEKKKPRGRHDMPRDSSGKWMKCR
jgi:hypothetical protein